MASSVALAVTSQVTQVLAVAVFLYEGFAYNALFIRRVLPAVDAEAWLLPRLVAFNTIWALALWSYLRAFISDPGVVPARWQDFVRGAGDKLPVVNALPEWQPGKATLCKKCNASRPERTHHCTICGKCIMRMDHHCPWINNCVGFKNHKFFLLLGLYACMASITAIITTAPALWCCATVLLRPDKGSPSKVPLLADSEVYGFLAFGLLALLVFLLLVPLLITHLSLAARNLTSIEENYENMPNPFDQGSALRNLEHIFGAFGLDWLLPIEPCMPVSDGVSFARADEPLGSDGSSDGGRSQGAGMEQEDLWRLRYRVLADPAASSHAESAPIASFVRWLSGT